VEVALKREGMANLTISVNRSARCSMFAWGIAITISFSCSVFEVAGVNVKVG